MKNTSLRLFFLALFFVTIFLIGVDAYLQYTAPFLPSYLDHIERLVMLIIAIICFMGSLQFYSQKVVRISQNLLLIIFSALGMIIASWHIWLENQASNLANTPTQTLMPEITHNLSLSALIHLIYTGAGTSYQIQWSKFGITLTDWTLVAFTFFFVIAVVLWFTILAAPKK